MGIPVVGVFVCCEEYIILEYVLVFGIALIGTLYSALTGGGTSVITLPLYLSMGIPLLTVFSIQKFSGLFMAATTARSFLRGKVINWRFLRHYTLLGMLGAILGIIVLIRIDEEIVRPMIGIALLGAMVLVIFRPRLGRVETVESCLPAGTAALVKHKYAKSVALLFAFPLGFYEGLFGSGNAILNAIVTVSTRGFDLITALGYYYASAFFWVLVSLAVLIHGGHYDISLMIPAALGAFVGSTIGSRGVHALGNRRLRSVLLLAGIFMALRMIFL